MMDTFEKGKLFNYADDNTLSFSHPDFATLITVLEQESRVLIDWFFRNQMKTNPDKFQAFAVGGRTFDEKPTFKIGEAEIACEETVKLLGIEIDSGPTSVFEMWSRPWDAEDVPRVSTARGGGGGGGEYKRGVRGISPIKF